MDSLCVPETYLAEARERFSTLGQLIVSGHDVFDRALEEFKNLILLYAAQSKRHGKVRAFFLVRLSVCLSACPLTLPLKYS